MPVTFDSSRAYEHLRRQVGFGPRPAGSAALARCREYILAELKAVGIETREQAFDATTPLGRVRMVNLIATIPGRRTERIALATHYDTKLFREFRFVGASDAASSTAAVLELARVLKARQNEFTIELLFFDGEEAVVDWYRNDDNTYGSRRYVETARQTGTLAGLRAFVLLDMIGDRNLTIRPRFQLDAVAHRHHLGLSGETRLPGEFPLRRNHHRRRPYALPARGHPFGRHHRS